MATRLQWITHASCLIIKDEYFLLTDPWFLKKAFTSWTTKPPSVINPKLLIDLTKSGKLGIIISHHHFDHYDIDFIKQCNKYTPIFIADFCENKKYNFPEVKVLYNSLIKDCEMKNIIEIPIGEEYFHNFGPFKIRKLRETSHDIIDSITTIESNDCFIIHGNDATGVPINSPAAKILKKIKPDNLPSIWMGQGGTANGWPLNYFCYNKNEKKEILEAKNLKLINEVYQTCKTFNIDKAILYAHLSHVVINGYDFFKEYNYVPCSGKKANKITNSNIFLDIQPSSIVIPSAKFNIINLIPTMDLVEYFEDNMRNTPFNNYIFDDIMHKKLNLWLDDLELFCKNENKKGNVNDEDIDLVFKIIITDNIDENNVLYERQLKFINGTREKILKCNVSLIGNILNGKIPFKDLSVGYLGQWSRKPKDYYNFNFLAKILNKHTHTYFKCNVLDL
tara:strand:- start:2084 stop:3430 length:1347 start_codon:yes stop_codon:yes gene_type:complete